MEQVPATEESSVTSQTFNLQGANNVYINSVVTTGGHREPSEDNMKRKSSVSHVRNSLESFTKRSAYEEIREKQLNKSMPVKTIKYKQRTNLTVSVLHLYGIPGSGKTEIVRKLADEFPYCEDHEILVKYEIDCRDGDEDIPKSLKCLLKEMLNRSLISNDADYKSACSGLEKYRTQAFVKLLCDATVPILIIIQDPPKQHQMLLTDLVSSLKKTTSTIPIHVYVTSNSKSTLSNLSATEEYEVTGLTKEEGLKMLRVCDTDSEEEDRTAAVKIFEDLSGSPLGLVAVETYCRMTDITYSDYLHLKSHSSYKTITKHLTDKFGPNYNHIFDAVIRLLNKDGLLDQMKTIGMFHHGSVPRRLIAKMIQKLKMTEESDPVRINLFLKQESGLFINQLEDFSFCKVNKRGKESKVTFHQVVFSAMEAHLLNQESSEFVQHLNNAILSISSVVNKDLRKREDLVFMRSMRPHMKVILQHVEEHKDVAKDFLVNMAINHLREVFGVINTDSNQKSAEESLELSARMIWKEVSSRSENDIDFDLFLNKQDEPVEQCASRIIEACIGAGEGLQRSGFDVAQYVSLVLQMKEEDINYLSSLSSNESFTEYLRKASKFSLGLSAKMIKHLRADPKNLVLDENKHYKVFFIDRLISVVYTLSRVILYDSDDVTTERWEKFLWISDLANALSVECRKVTGVKLLFLWLSASVQIDVRQKRRANLDENQKKAILQETRILAVRNLKEVFQEDEQVQFRSELTLEENNEVFENGVRKSVVDNIFQQLSRFRSLVRIDAKLWRLCTPDEREKLQQTADHYCETLNKKATDTLETWNQSAKCIVYCGKYLAAKGEYEQAVQHFLRAFDSKDGKDSTSKFFPWLCYNYARSMCLGNLQECKQDALEKCRKAMEYHNMIADDLLEKLKLQISVLES